MQRMELLPGMYLTSVQTDRFKSACLSISLLRPLCREEAAQNALLASVLIQGTALHPTMQDLSLALDNLYGASLGPLVRKNGQVQTCGLYAGFLEDRFALPGDRILAPMVELLTEVLLQPRLVDGSFCPDIVAREQENLISTIESTLNDKRAYADAQMLKAMCRDDAFAVPRLGEPEDVRAITPQSLSAHYRHILAHSQIEIFYAGSATAAEVSALLRRSLAGLPREHCATYPIAPLPRREEVQQREETMAVTQGKLAMGFTTGITTKDPDYPALMALSAIYGGDLTSKLFQNVRERLSLCYYASSTVFGAKGILAVSTGIETGNYHRAKEEILRQLTCCQQGQITPQELSDAQKALCSSLDTISDSPGRMEDYTMFCLLSGFPLEPEAYKRAVLSLTVEDISRVARSVRLDTIFFLKGESA